AGDHAGALAEARAGVVVADPTSLLLVRADAHRMLAEVLRAAGRGEEAACAAREALALDERKGNLVAAAARRRVLAEIGVAPASRASRAPATSDCSLPYAEARGRYFIP